MFVPGSLQRVRHDSAKLCVAVAADEVIVDHADGLHEGVADRRTDKAETAAAQRAAERDRFRRGGRHLVRRAPGVLPRRAVHEPPEEAVEAALLLYECEYRARV